MEARLEHIRSFVHGRIREIAAAKREPAPELDDSLNLVEAGLFDSLGFVNLVSAIEKEFDLEIDPGDSGPEEFTILGNLIRAAAGSAPAPSAQEESR